ncbi:hypothetical protein L6164_013160 [Bauhinia variegata]|uniref:Uncharacterized protein n=1 Tax=Bauhinia variegata TaxID=167791 RepID=A0ACB9PC85_BAUVA|nr:hypothetical protein L6164_013160 [Bauhinia variegata]
MAVSTSLLSSIPTVASNAKVAPVSKVTPVARVAPIARFAPVARFSPVASVKVKTDKTSELVLPLSRRSFPDNFIFGAATAAYHIEGGIDSRGRSAWDEFTYTYPEKITDRSNGDVACNSYNLYMDDVELLTDMGFDAYRFSISWSRILPTGKLKDGINEEGVNYYNDLLDALIANGKTPFVTLDLPQPLEEEYGGFLDSRMVDDFKDFCDVCFEKFGDKVKYWMTLNEPYNYVDLCYSQGLMAPARCSCWQNLKCLGGDSSTEPYIVGHHLLLAHSAAVDLYNT